MKNPILVVLLGAACLSSPLAAFADDDEEKPSAGRVTIVLDVLSAVAVGLEDPAFGPASAARIRFEKAVSSSVALWAAPQFRLMAITARTDESIDAVELAVGARHFAGGLAPEGYFLGGFASVGRGSFRVRERTQDEITDDGKGFTWSLGGNIGKEWITRGGLSLGLRLDIGISPLSLQEPSTGLFFGLGTSLGGVL